MQKSKHLLIRRSLLAICVASVMMEAYATTEDEEQKKAVTPVVAGQVLPTIEVQATEEKREVAVIKKDAETLSKEMVQDSRDLVRHETGVTVVEKGRFGASGYAVRGVDENRVGIVVDGLRQAETLSSQGFRELFEGYGNFNNTRNSVEIETVKVATINKGADSVRTGSGALGGSVIFETKDARDYLQEKDVFASYKAGYSTANNQLVHTGTLAGRVKGFDALFIGTKRDGHEMENYGYKSYDNATVGREREKADPYHIESYSKFIKLGYQPNDNHRFSALYDDSEMNTQGEDLSYTLRSGRYVDTLTKGQRLTDDTALRRNVQFAYENTWSNPLWDKAKLSYSSQKISNNARSDEYCFRDTCNSVSNPHGLKVDKSGATNRIVDGSGGALGTVQVVGRYSTTTEITDSQGVALAGDAHKKVSVENRFINCSTFDCTKPFEVFLTTDENGQDVNQFVNRDIVIGTTADGTKFGYIPIKEGVTKYSWGEWPSKEQLSFIMPRSSGYSQNNYHDRDLNTDTKQFNLDLQKNFSLWGTDHAVSYGGVYSKSDKYMVDKDGYQGGNVRWWADAMYCKSSSDESQPDTTQWGSGSCTGDLISNTNTRSSFLIPVETKTTAFYFGDDVRLTDWLSVTANYRYDKIQLNPSYDYDVPVPKGMIAGIFVPFKANEVTYGWGANCGYKTDCYNNNFQQNLNILLRSKQYENDSYHFGITLEPLSWFKIQAKYANAFRAPTADEVYMTFKHPSFSIAPNTDLEAETAKTKEVALTFQHNRSYFTVNAFSTNYDNFIDLVPKGEREVDEGSTIKYPFWQNVNQQHAKVKGVEITSLLELGDVWNSLDGFRVGYKFTRQKGMVDVTDHSTGQITPRPMNAIQPMTSVFNVGYSSPNDQFGSSLFITHASKKKVDDTYDLFAGTPTRFQSGSYTLVDLTSYFRPTKNITLQAGVFNLTNRKYATWDSIRSIRSFGTSNLVAPDGTGLNRFLAPERNYKFSVEFKF
ncbi:MAG: TonB-dependent hemoglobin/transferrin/lactoferrin family receptor [Acinetobacter sp.]|nr:TonB-dependent hemoglobin/transferrin/lactoferrin family receptor [Acinetobacter sp.]